MKTTRKSGALATVGMLVCASGALLLASLAVTAPRTAPLALVFMSISLWSICRWAVLRNEKTSATAREELKRAEALLEQGRAIEAGEVALEVVKRARVYTDRNAGLNMVAWAALGAGDPRRAREALSFVRPSRAVDCYTLAAVESALGRTAAAIEVLERRRAISSTLSRSAARLLVDLYVTVGNFARAAAVARDLCGVLGAGDTRLVIRALEAAGEPGHAAALAASTSQLAEAAP